MERAVGMTLLAGTVVLSPILGVSQPSSPSAAPWWGTALLAGIFVIVGGAISAWSGWWADERRHKRELRRRWDDDLRRHAADFLSAVDTYMERAQAVKIEEDIFPPSSLDDSEWSQQQRARIAVLEQARIEAFRSMRRHYELLAFIAPESLTNSARSLDVWISIAENNLHKSSFVISTDEVLEKRAAFINELRKALDLTPLS